MQLTKLRAAPELQAEVPPCAPAGGSDGGTASQLIRSVGWAMGSSTPPEACLSGHGVGSRGDPPMRRLTSNGEGRRRSIALEVGARGLPCHPRRGLRSALLSSVAVGGASAIHRPSNPGGLTRLCWTVR
jgi:hypothetical protein